MAIFSKEKPAENLSSKKRFHRGKWFRIFLVIVFLGIAGGSWAMYKTGVTLSRISTKDGLMNALWKTIPGIGSDKLEGEEDGQINVLLIGMRGNNMPGGGLLADSIIAVIIRPMENRIALASIPRDLYVKLPNSQTQTKINAVHSLSEERGEGMGMEAMKKVAGEVLGIPIHYSVRIDFNGFKELVDALGGIDIYLDKPFSEPTQFEGESALDFSLPAGKNHIDGQKALFFVRSRYTSSDFERAKRQQLVLIALKDKMLSMGTLSDFGKVNNIMTILGEDIRADMDITEMKKFFNLANSMNDSQIKQKVFDESQAGLLYSTRVDTPEGKTYILLPAGDNYDQIHALVKNIFQ